MKSLGWTGASLVAFLSTTIFLNSGLFLPASAERPEPMVVHGDAEGLASEAGTRYRFGQARHWRQVLLTP